MLDIKHQHIITTLPFKKKSFEFYHPNYNLFEEKQEVDYVYLVLAGKVNITKNRHNETVPIHTFTNGDILGVDATLKGNNYMYTATTQSDTLLFKISAHDFITQLNPNLRFELIKYLSKILIKFDLKLIE